MTLSSRVTMYAALLLVASLSIVSYIGVDTAIVMENKINNDVSGLLEKKAKTSYGNAIEMMAYDLQAQLEVPLDSVRTLASVYGNELENPAVSRILDRENVPKLQINLLKDNPDWVYVYSEWDTDILGRDSDYLKHENSSVKGRFTPTARRDEDGKFYSSGYDTENGEWYTCATSSGKDCLTNPLKYEVDGKMELMTEITSPILMNNKPVGIVGASVRTTNIQKQMQDYKRSILNSAGEIYVISQNKIIVANTADESAVGQKLAESSIPSHETDLILRSGSFFDDQIGDQVLFRTKINFGNMPDGWDLVILIKKDVFLAENRSISEMMNDEISALVTKISSFSAITILVSCLVIWFVVKALLQPLNTITSSIIDIARGGGDLTQRLDIIRQDEIGRISESINTLFQTLQAMVSKIINAEKGLAESSNHSDSAIQETNAELLNNLRTLDQAVVAIEELASSSTQVADNATSTSDTNQLAVRSVTECKAIIEQNVQHSEQTSAQLQSAADKIITLTESSDKITSVLNSIDEISEQTNLLALNAAIESARAGEAGRGFAVVADEVRALAKRSQESVVVISDTVKSFNDVIEQVSQAILQGKDGAIASYQASEEARVSMEEVERQIQMIADYNTQTASAAEEQSVVSAQISQSMTDIMHSLNATGSLSEQALNHTQKLKQHGSEIKGLIGAFKV